ncbi:hypothetical protein [Pseudoalteromonas spongiae]|uniref:hypothetical protein n=1 Tax=Pseudoalteromonas spongiae TaxID=298657 RepID=UPI003734C16A
MLANKVTYLEIKIPTINGQHGSLCTSDCRLGSRLKTYLYGDDLISQTDSANTTNTFHYDGLGSTRLLSSEAGEQSDSYTI